MNKDLYISPNWPAPKAVHAFTTTRRLKKKSNRYSSFNLAMHVGDDPDQVEQNRQTLQQELNLSKTPHWLNQTHGNDVIELPNSSIDADASFTHQANHICAVLTADCLPLLLCNERGDKVAAVHAGWRGLYNGIIQKTVTAFQENPSNLLAWLGPAISSSNYEVNQELYEKFIALNPNFSAAFQQLNNSWYCDLYTLARIQLSTLQIKHIYGGSFCTYAESENFYSHRREGPETGRIATLIWHGNH